MSIERFIEGTPKPQPRPRAVARGGFARVYNPKTADDWKQSVRDGFKGVQLDCEQVSVFLLFKMPRAKLHFNTRGELKPSAPRDHTKRPDVDNLAKAVLDALVDQGVIKDDSLVTRLEVAKEYETETGAGCLIKIKTA